MNLLEFINKVDSTDNDFVTVDGYDYRIKYFDKSAIECYPFKPNFPSDFKMVSISQNIPCTILIFTKEVHIRFFADGDYHFDKDTLKDPEYAILSQPFLRKEL